MPGYCSNEFMNVPECAQCLMAAHVNNYTLLKSTTFCSQKSYKEGGGASGPVEDILVGTEILHMMQPF